MNIVLISPVLSPVPADLRPSLTALASWWCDGGSWPASPSRMGGEGFRAQPTREGSRESDHELTGDDQWRASCRARQPSWQLADGERRTHRCCRENRCCTCSSRRSRFSQRRASRVWTGAVLFLKFSFASFAQNRLVRRSKRRHHPFGLTKGKGRPTQRSMPPSQRWPSSWCPIHVPPTAWVLRKNREGGEKWEME